MRKTPNFGNMNPVLGKFRVTYDFGWWLVGKPMVDFLFYSRKLFFSLCIMVPELWGKMCTAVFPLPLRHTL